MRVNCDTANKLVRQLSAEMEKLLRVERGVSTYSYLYGEEPYKPDYDFNATQAKLTELENKIVTLKHAINMCNTTTKVPNTDLTIDQALVKISMLSTAKNKLERMRSVLEQSRSSVPGSKVTEITIRNYSEEDVEAAYKATCEQLITLQQGLDSVNLTWFFEVDIEV